MSLMELSMAWDWCGVGGPGDKVVVAEKGGCGARRSSRGSMPQKGRAVMKKQFGQMAAEHMVACNCGRPFKV